MNEIEQYLDEKLEDDPVLEFGAIYNAKIVEIRSSGVMVELFEGMTPALVHNSQLDVAKVTLIISCFKLYFDFNLFF